MHMEHSISAMVHVLAYCDSLEAVSQAAPKALVACLNSYESGIALVLKAVGMVVRDIIHQGVSNKDKETKSITWRIAEAIRDENLTDEVDVIDDIDNNLVVLVAIVVAVIDVVDIVVDDVVVVVSVVIVTCLDSHVKSWDRGSGLRGR